MNETACNSTHYIASNGTKKWIKYDKNVTHIKVIQGDDFKTLNDQKSSMSSMFRRFIIIQGLPMVLFCFLFVKIYKIRRAKQQAKGEPKVHHHHEVTEPLLQVTAPNQMSHDQV